MAMHCAGKKKAEHGLRFCSVHARADDDEPYKNGPRKTRPSTCLLMMETDRMLDIGWAEHVFIDTFLKNAEPFIFSATTAIKSGLWLKRFTETGRNFYK
jgi:hypothetical protein